MTPRRVNILRNRTKLDANGPTETLHPNKPHVLRRESAEGGKKKGKAHQTLATMNLISRNNDGHQKGSLKCKIQRDRARSVCGCASFTRFTIIPPIRLCRIPLGSD